MPSVVWSKVLRGLFLVGISGCAGSGAPVRPHPSSLDLRIIIDKPEYFQGEPIFAVFELSNAGTDTAWIGHYEEDVKAELLRDGMALPPSGGLVVDYLYPPRWCGDPLLPGHSRFVVLALQQRWGNRTPEYRHMYAFGGPLEPGNYRLRLHYAFDARAFRCKSRPTIETAAVGVEFTIRARTAAEDSSLRTAVRLADLPWDEPRRPEFLPQLLADSRRRVAVDSTDPLLLFQLPIRVVTASAIGLQVDDTTRRALTDLAEALAFLHRDRAAGAFVIGAANWLDPAAVKSTSVRFDGSLVGRVLPPRR